MPKKMQPDGSSNTGHDKLFKGFATGASNLAGYLIGKNKSLAGGMGLTRKGESEWTATFRLWSVKAQTWLVAFGNGPDPIAALLALNAAIQNKKFYKDKFAREARPTWPTQAALADLLPQGQALATVSRETSGNVRTPEPEEIGGLTTPQNTVE